MGCYRPPIGASDDMETVAPSTDLHDRLCGCGRCGPVDVADPDLNYLLAVERRERDA